MRLTDKQRRAFGRYLRRHIRARGFLQKDLAAALGTHPCVIANWVQGRTFPSLAHAVELADVLGDERILAYARKLRRTSCVECGREFIDTTMQLKAQFCCMAHTATHWKRKQRERTASAYKADRHRLALYVESVDRHCRSCEPRGVCVTAECPLREVSPLPLARVGEAGVVTRKASDKMLAYLARRYDAA